MIGRVSRILLGTLSLNLLSSIAVAQPKFWQKLQDPSAARAERALRRIERVLDGVNQSHGDLDMMQDFRLGALAIAEMSGARALGDAKLSILLAQALLDADLGRESEATRLLTVLLDELNPGELWLEAEARVLLASAARGEPRVAIAAVTRALPLVFDASLRSALLRERAEAKMALRDVRGCLADQQAALAIARSPLQKALARFGLGLALERAGDLPAALSELRLARLTAPKVSGSDLGVLDLPGNFLFRPHDAHYVAALSAMALAATANEPELARSQYELALADWERFQALAPSADPFVPAARSHQAACERLRHAAARSHQAALRAAEASGGLW